MFPGQKFTMPGLDEVFTLKALSFTRAVITSDRVVSRTFEVTDKLTGQIKSVTVNKPFSKDVAPGTEVCALLD